MTAGEVLVIGGTSDGRLICQQLDEAGVCYTLSVATPTGAQLAGNIRGQVRCGRLEMDEMVTWLKQNDTRWVIDASHPYAEVVSHNIAHGWRSARHWVLVWVRSSRCAARLALNLMLRFIASTVLR
ncbi:MAG: cobalt-precorrin-6A reductase [Proteobacteria bacterium]|nr:cobalt-precorrin-6A reductase [Pseudomonadota bacterium]